MNQVIKKFRYEKKMYVAYIVNSELIHVAKDGRICKQGGKFDFAKNKFKGLIK
jgi:hypothetical protein